MHDETRRSHDELLRAYVRSLSGIPRVERSDIEELLAELKRLREQDDDRWRDARNKVVMHHLRLVVATARRLHYGPVPLLDLIQEGNLGLVRAAERFDLERGVPFPAYAVWWIRRNVLRAMEDQGLTVRVPGKAWALDRRVRGCEREWSLRCGSSPSHEEIADALEVSPAQVDRLRGAVGGSLSCESSTTGGTRTLGETLADPDALPPHHGVADSWMREAIFRGLGEIGERERWVLVLRWGLGGVMPLTQEQIGRRLGISGARVCQLENESLARLRSCSHLREQVGLG